MHHVGIALHIHQVFHLHRTILAHPAEIIATQINQHHVLGALLLIVPHLLFKAQVFGLVAPARVRARDGPIFQLASRYAHQHLRRGTENLGLSHPQKVKVWRRIHLSQGAVKIEWLDARDKIEPLRKHDLKNVARGNVLLAALYASQEFRTRGSGIDLELSRQGLV